MDFTDLSSYPIVADPDYSPTMDSFTYPDAYDKAYLADAYTNQPDYTFDSFFDQPVSSIEFSSGYPSSKSNSQFNPALPSPTAPWPVNQQQTDPSFAAFNQTAFPFTSTNPTATTLSAPLDLSQAQPQGILDQGQSSTRTSPTPSLCGDAPQSSTTTPQNINLKRESPSSPPYFPTSEPSSKRPQRKRGRPRLNRTTSAESSFSPPSSATYSPHTSGAGTSTANARQASGSSSSKRLPHNQVERKYREGLNSELERLRRAVPTLPQGAGEEATSSAANMLSQPKPSKAMVLAGAIEYIKRLEREKDDAIRECEVLRRERDEARLSGGVGGNGATGSVGQGLWDEDWRGGSDVY